MNGEGVGVLHVLVVEDKPIAAEAHTAYVERVPGFTVAATVGTTQRRSWPCRTGRSTWCCWT